MNLVHAGFLFLSAISQTYSPNAFHRFESKLHGFTAQIPDGFEEIPVQPGEKIVLHKFTDRKPHAFDSVTFHAEIWILAFPKPATPPRTPATETPFAAWVRENLSGWKCGASTPLESAGGIALSQHKLESPANNAPYGFAYSLEGESRSLFLLGLAPQKKICPDCDKIFEHSARSIREKAPSNPLVVDWESFYRGNIYRGVPYRIEVRKRLAQGWKAEDTDNFIVVASTADQQLVGKVKRDLESIRTKFVEMFPPVREIEAISTARICKDAEEFRKYSGAPPHVAGYWNPKSEELVFFDASSVPSPANRKGEMSYAVLYHEAFHQYIHYAIGEVEIHPWVNEGLGDYFSGATIGKNARRVARVEANPFRLGVARQLAQQGKHVPFSQFLRLEKPAYYADYARCYAQGWSLVYFLLESPQAKKNAAWRGLIKNYFDEIQRTRGKANALEAALAGVDLGKLEEAWREFTISIEEPK